MKKYTLEVKVTDTWAPSEIGTRFVNEYVKSKDYNGLFDYLSGMLNTYRLTIAPLEDS